MERIFVQLNDEQIVIDAIVIAEENCLDQNGEFSEVAAQGFIATLGHIGTWIESRLDGSVRKRPAVLGGKYLLDLDEFRPEQPYLESTWNDEIGEWENPEFDPGEEFWIALQEANQASTP
jgi:hypothetical protein